MKRSILFAGMALTALLARAPAQGAFLDQGAFLAAAEEADTTPIRLPAQGIVLTDAFGSYTPETRGQPVFVGGIFDRNGQPYSNPTEFSTLRNSIGPVSAAEGQLSGGFGCASPIFPCLGAHTITYTLPFKISGLGGELAASFGSVGPSSLPFFEIGAGDYALDPGTGNTPFRYTGFWGTVFGEPTDTFSIVWTPGLQNADDLASFLLTNAVALVAAGAVVPVSEPAALALFLLALLGLGLIRREGTRMTTEPA